MSKTYQFSMYNSEVTTTVIANVPELDRCLQQLLSTMTFRSEMKRVVGLEIEKIYEATISPPKSKLSEKVAILKLSHGTTCLIIQLHLLSSLPFSLLAFLQRPELSFAGVGIAKSMAALERDYSINCRNTVDLAHLTASVYGRDIFRSYGLLDLASRLCTFKEFENMVKNFNDVALSNWGVTLLSHSQIEAATFTCIPCFYLANQLLLKS